MTGWPAKLLGDQIEIFNRRRVPLSRIDRVKRQGPYRYFGAQGVIDQIDDYIFDGEFVLVAEDGENLRSQKQPIASLVSGRFWVNNHAHIIRAQEGVADNRFLLHAINHAPISGAITGAAQPKLTKTSLQSLEIPCPPFDVQRRVATLLAAFDGIIEINQRRIELLEDLARSLYREWFIRFRFPGHAQTAFAESSLGRVPSGWDVRCLSDVVTTQYGYTATASIDAVGPRFLRGMDINKRSFVDWSKVPYCVIDAVGHNKFRLEIGDVCVIRMADPGKVGIVEVPIDAVFASYLVRLRSLEPRFPAYLLFSYLDSAEYQSWVSGSSTGSTRKSASAAVLTEPNVLVPPLEIAVMFDDRIRTIRGRMACLVEERATLAATLDLLLPRLVTGRLDISEINLGDLLNAEAA